MAQGIRKALNEDQMIIDVVKYYSFKLYDKAKVVFLSNDNYARLFAKHSGVATASFDKLEKNLENAIKTNPNQAWNSDLFLKCIPKAFLSDTNAPLPDRKSVV